jgi:hypothetical protein
VYLVTAKHNLQTESGHYRVSIMYRMNTQQNTSRYVELVLSKHTMLEHPDERVDLVATLQTLPQKDFDYLHMSENYFTNAGTLEQKGTLVYLSVVGLQHD